MEFPADLDKLETATADYRTLPGWQSTLRGQTDWNALPAQARDYVAAIEQLSGRPVGIVSTGPDNVETVLRKEHLEKIGLA